MVHETSVPKQLETVDMPSDPLDHWTAETVKRQFVDSYRRYSNGCGGWLRSIALRRLHDELVNRGISPVVILDDAGIDPSDGNFL